MVQFGRWKITNSLLVRRIAKGMRAEIAQGNYKGQNTRRLLKMLVTAGGGLYVAYELGKAGYKEGEKIARAASELVLTIFDLATGESIYGAIAKNPEIQTLSSLTYSMQQLANYVTFGIVDEPKQLEFQRGIEDMYIAAFDTLGINQQETKSRKINPFLPSKPREKKNPFLD